MYNNLNNNSFKKYLIFLFIAGVSISTIFAHYKQELLGFHTRDFAFYLGFIAKLLDSNLQNLHSINPDGYNFWGFNGTEATKNFHQAIHLEPIKYLYSAIYKIFNSALPVFLVHSLIFFYPILYLAKHYKPNDKYDFYFISILALVYFIYPTSLHAALFDLRPYSLLAPIIFLSVLSIHLNRPFYEILLFFTALFIIREEAILLNIPILLFFIASKYKNLETKKLLSLCIIWLAFALTYIIYFRWTGYELDDQENTFRINFLVSLLFAATIIVTSISITLAWKQIKTAKTNILSSLSPICAYSTVFIPIIYQLINFIIEKKYSFKEALIYIINGFVNSPRYHLHVTLILILLFLIFQNLKNIRFKKIFISTLIIISLGSFLIQARTPYKYIRFNALRHAQIIWEFKKQINYDNNILADYNTAQAFYNHNNIYVYNRLPWHILEGKERFYPSKESINTLIGLLNHKIEYIVISNKNSSDIQELLDKSKINNVTILYTNKLYKIIKIER